jgi:hypothetical protein
VLEQPKQLRRQLRQQQQAPQLNAADAARSFHQQQQRAFGDFIANLEL